MERFVQLVVYVPQSHVERLKEALCAAGAGKMGRYDCCCWQTTGEGQFRPLKGSNPFLGGEGEITRTAECKLEFLVSGNVLEQVLAALRRTHPYETPAFHYFPVEVI